MKVTEKIDENDATCLESAVDFYWFLVFEVFIFSFQKQKNDTKYAAAIRQGLRRYLMSFFISIYVIFLNVSQYNIFLFQM